MIIMKLKRERTKTEIELFNEKFKSQVISIEVTGSGEIINCEIKDPIAIDWLKMRGLKE